MDRQMNLGTIKRDTEVNMASPEATITGTPAHRPTMTHFSINKSSSDGNIISINTQRYSVFYSMSHRVGFNLKAAGLVHSTKHHGS